MLKKFYKSKRFEEILGIVGLAYIIILGVIAATLITFLVNVTRESLAPDKTRASTITQFAIGSAERL